ncbi:MAG: chromosome segregation SMC family protein, partial [Pseudomonadota bacterium]
MKLKRLRLTGFKSFVDQTELVIEDGLTGVVGPNGCGKSNIVDALRWVMGESSYKAMRGSGMDDVIFAGSAHRPSRNIAEVTLQINNSARTAPAPFNHDDLLEVSRKITREAGSSYRVNGREARARDIGILFADAASGARSSAMVRQGQIGEMIAAKPTARRRVIEDAAGISGLHGRRHEAELRLKAADANLERLDDIIAQISQQLESLKRQARQAAKFKALSGEIRKRDALAAHLRWEAASKALGDAKGERDRLVRDVAAATEALSKANRANAIAASELPAKRNAEAEAAARMTAVQTALDRLESEQSRISARLKEIAALTEQIKADIARETGLDAETAPILQRLADESAALTQKNTQSESERATANESAALARDARDTAEEALVALTDEAAQATALKARHEEAVRLAKQQIETLDVRRARAVAERGAIEGDTAPRTAHETAIAAEKVALAALAEAETGFSTAEAARQNASDRRSAARDRLAEARRVLQSIETERSTLEAVLSAGADDRFTPVIDSVRAAEGYETALGAAFGADLDYPDAEDAAIHWRETGSDPTSDGLLPDGAAPLADHVNAPAVLARRLALVGVVADDSGAALQAKLLPGQVLVSRAGAVWRWDGLVSRADAASPAAVRLKQRNRVAALTVETGEAQEAVSKAVTVSDGAESAFKTAEDALATARYNVQTARHASQQAAITLRETERAFAALDARQTSIVTEIARVDEALEAAREALQHHEAALRGANDPEALREAVDTARETAARARDDAAAAESARAALEQEAAARVTRLAAISAEQTAWNRRLASAKEQMDRLQARLHGATAERDALDAKPGELTEEKLRLGAAL